MILELWGGGILNKKRSCSKFIQDTNAKWNKYCVPCILPLKYLRLLNILYLILKVFSSVSNICNYLFLITFRCWSVVHSANQSRWWRSIYGYMCRWFEVLWWSLCWKLKVENGINMDYCYMHCHFQICSLHWERLSVIEFYKWKDEVN